MLQHLTISHYALIENLDIDWQNGFSVITGETGAGKSIILGALNLLLGGRADTKAIQSGQNKCMIEAIFNIEELNLESFFIENDIDYDEKECIIRREVMLSGKSRAFINDSPLPASKLKEISDKIIDIHSQHQNLLIKNESFLIDTLDTIAEQPEALAKYRLQHKAYKEAVALLEKLQQQADKGKTDQDYLQFQLSQIDEAQLQTDEQNDLETEQNILNYSEEIKQAYYGAQSMLNAEDFSVAQNLKHATEKLRGITTNDSLAIQLAERLESVRIELDDIEAEITQHAETIEYNPARLAFIEERLNTIYELEQKHRVKNIGELLTIAESLREKLSTIENLDENIAQQKKKVDELTKARAEAAAQLTKTRKNAARNIEKELTVSLKQLGMPNVEIVLQITPRMEFDYSGADNVTFLFSGNKNIPPQDVKQIASGGEIARMMLALKALIAKKKALPTILFDEVDTGVSGSMAEKMAKVMQQISNFCQVICITHLPQIAACGTNQYKVYKEDTGDATRSHIKQLNNEERIEEIAHMLSGSEITQAAISNAKALLKK